MSTLAETHDALMLDLDGTVYLGGQPIDHVAPALARAKQQGARSVFVTNNASRPPAEVAESLDRDGRCRRAGRRPDLTAGGRRHADRPAPGRHQGARHRCAVAGRVGHAGRPDAGPVGHGRSGGRRPGPLPGDRLARTGRGLHRAARRCRLGGLQRRQHPADRSRSATRATAPWSPR